MNQRLRDKIKALQEKSASLEPSAEQRDALTDKVWQYSKNYLNELPDRDAYIAPQTEDDEPKFQDRFTEEPTSMDDLLSFLTQNVDDTGITSSSAGHLGYIPGSSLYPSALGDYMAAITNHYAGVEFAGPGAVQLENECIDWLCDLIGYSSTAGGNLTSGGSMANLIALANARDAAGISADEYKDAVIYTTHQVHHCVIKAIKFAGLADATLQLIPMDDQFRMKAGALSSQIDQDRREGLRPLIVFGSAGTTDIGAVDPLNEIARISQENDIWFHVDAAYGGGFLLTDYGKNLMEGIEKADSVTIDPHKSLFLPYGTGALLVKDVQKLYESQHMAANYLQDTYQEKSAYSPSDLSPELTKHFRGLRMWLPLKLYGIAPFRDTLNEKLLLTRYFYNEIKKIDYVETPDTPQLSITYFRYVPQGEEADANAFNKRLIDEFHKDGRVFLSSTHIDETIYIRMAILNFKTHLETVDKAIDFIKEKINELKTEKEPANQT